MSTRPTEVRCVFSNIQFRHPAHDSSLGDTVFHCKGWPVVEPKPKVSVRWEKPPKTKWPSLDHKMWVGRCAGCGDTTQYWSWGAALGHMLEHQWIGCEADERRAADRRRKYNRTEARLSCGGRTHGIMGEDRGDTVRRTDVPKYVSPRDQVTALLAGEGSPPADDRGPILGGE
jgi:hypothetical protein